MSERNGQKSKRKKVCVCMRVCFGGKGKDTVSHEVRGETGERVVVKGEAEVIVHANEQSEMDGSDRGGNGEHRGGIACLASRQSRAGATAQLSLVAKHVG